MGRARAIVIQDDAVLLIERCRGGRTYWVFPGGGIEPGETAADAARREVAEETGLLVEIQRRVAIVTFPTVRQHFFLASLTGGTIGTGTGEEVTGKFDPGQGTSLPVWFPLADLDGHEVLPVAVVQLVKQSAITGWPIDAIKATESASWWLDSGDPRAI